MTAPPAGTIDVGAAKETGRSRCRRLNGAAALGIAVVGFWVVVALVGPLLAPHDPDAFVGDNFARPGGGTLLGTDYIGRDVLSRLIYGARLTLGMAFVATLIASGIGTSIGLLAAVRRGWTDIVLSRIGDALLSFPTILMGLVVVAALGASIPILVLTTGLIYTPGVFRIARALAMNEVVMDYVLAAQARGERTGWILYREVLPNVVQPLLVDFGLRLCFAILLLSALSFLGLGVQPPQADWGSLVRENMEGLPSGSLAPLIPAFAIASLTVGLNLIVDAFGKRRSRVGGG